MRSDIASVILALVTSGVTFAAPTYSCFNPPAVEGQINPLGEEMRYLVETKCCEALVDDGDIVAGRLVVWDPINCNYGPSETAIAEAFLCRAHDTDGCRFCHQSCDGFEGLCLKCDEVIPGATNPRAIPVALAYPTFGTLPPFGIFPETPSPSPAPTQAPIPVNLVVNVDGDNEIDCSCLEDMSDTEAKVLANRGVSMRCDRTCSNGKDLVWGVLNCNYFALGPNCRTCADTCGKQSDGVWLDQYGAFCKPCSAIS